MKTQDADSIDTLLRSDASLPIADAGFSVRVLEALPQDPRSAAWLKPALVLGSAAVGSALAWSLAPAGTSLFQGFLDLARLQANTPSALAALGLALAMGVFAAVIVADEG